MAETLGDAWWMYTRRLNDLCDAIKDDGDFLDISTNYPSIDDIIESWTVEYGNVKVSVMPLTNS
jgi:hypothetical protein